MDMAEIIDGKAVALEIRSKVRDDLADVKNKSGKIAGLAVVIVGEDSASQVYVRMKHRACKEAGITSLQHELPVDTSEDELLKLVNSLNNNPAVNGILVQLPLPKHIDENKVIETIVPEKDVDGFHPINVGRMLIAEEDCFMPCTPYGCQELISRYVKDLKGKHLVVVGRSNIVGKPIATMMYQKNSRANCTVTICHTGTKDLKEFTRQADILVVAAGRVNTITADMVKEGVVVIDVGMNRIEHPDDKNKSKLFSQYKLF